MNQLYRFVIVSGFIYCVWIADAGKSTIGGQILLLSVQVDDRTIQKYEKEAKEKSRESWQEFPFALLKLMCILPSIQNANWLSS